MPYQLAYKDRYIRFDEGKIESDTTGSVAFASIPDDIPTRLITEWTGKQFTKLFSSVYMGAHLIFPEQAHEIIWQLLKVVHQPINPEIGDGCAEYPNYSSFISYEPNSPFGTQETVAGWNKNPWFRWGDFDTLFPDWIDNWLNGVVGALLGYDETDILFNIESVPINPIEAFLEGEVIFPKIEIQFSGEGTIEVELLSFPLGGKAVIELDQEPNVIDILTGGILDPAAFMVELNRDIVNFPPDEYPIVNIEIPVTTAGSHVLYIVFIPIVNDELIPLGFGGGIRSVELCVTEEEPEMGIQQIFWDGCELKKIVNGVTSTIVTSAQIEACLNIPSGGGGGVTGLVVKNYVQAPPAPSFNTSSTTFVAVTGFSRSHTFSKPNALVLVQNLSMTGTGGNFCEIRVKLDGNIGLDATLARISGNENREVDVSDRWESLTEGSKNITLEMRVTGGAAAFLQQQVSLNIIVIEFDNADDLFVQDIRIFEGELQKKIGGVWIDVTDSLEAMLSAISAQASSAQAAAAAAQTTANNAVATNTVQTGQIVALQSGLGALTLRVDDAEDMLEDHETRIDALEVAGGGDPLGVWGGFKLRSVGHSAMTPGLGYYSSFNSFDSAIPVTGWEPVNVAGQQAVNVFSTNANRFGSAAYIRLVINEVDAPQQLDLVVSINGGPEQRIRFASFAGNYQAWVKVPDSNNADMSILVKELAGNANWRLSGATYLTLNVNPFTGELWT